MRPVRQWAYRQKRLARVFTVVISKEVGRGRIDDFSLSFSKLLLSLCHFYISI